MRRILGYWARGSRRIGGVNPVQALVRNYGNQGLDAKGEVTSGESHEASVPMLSPGADQLVRAMKAGNAAGAKGLGQAAAVCVQPATGGGV